jgi:hypothetical protein
MGVPTSEVGYTSVTTGRGDHTVLKGNVVAWQKNIYMSQAQLYILLNYIRLIPDTSFGPKHVDGIII